MSAEDCAIWSRTALLGWLPDLTGLVLVRRHGLCEELGPVRGRWCGRQRPYAPPPGSMVVILVALQEAYILVFTVESQFKTLLDDKGAGATFWCVAVIGVSTT